MAGALGPKCRRLDRAIALAAVSLAILAVGGCASVERMVLSEPAPQPSKYAPYGPGVAATADLSPHVQFATHGTHTGIIKYFLVCSHKGWYFTWALDGPIGDRSGCELDVRAVAADAERLRGQRVEVSGLLLPRRPYHVPLLIVQSIRAADEPQPHWVGPSTQPSDQRPQVATAVPDGS
jgi:hypothetical protein